MSGVKSLSTGLPVQGSLLELGPSTGPRPLGPSVERRELGRGAWLEVRRDWIENAAELFQRLLGVVDWQAERRTMYDRVVDVPRLTRFYGEGEPLPDPALEVVRARLTEHYRPVLGEPLRTVGLCLYRDGRDSVAWHGDTIGRGSSEDTVVAIVSLGDRRRFLVRPRGGGPGFRQDLGGGDLLVMGGSFQRTWEHSVPKTARPVGPRLSVQFRPRDVR